MNFFDPDILSKQYRFRAPMMVIYFLAGVAIARFHAYLLLWQPWVKPLLVGLWCGMGIIGIFAALSAYQRYLAGVPPIGEMVNNVIRHYRPSTMENISPREQPAHSHRRIATSELIESRLLFK